MARAAPLRGSSGVGPWSRFKDWRNGLIQKPGFQRFALAFPLTRPVARRHARRLFDMVAGFVYSQVLAAAVELKLFEQLADGPRGCAELAPALGLTPEALWVLIRALESLDLVEVRGDDVVALDFLGAALLANAGVREMIAHHAVLYRDLADPVGLLRRPRGEAELARFWAYAGAEAPDRASGQAVAAYSALMAASQPMVAQQALEGFSFAAHRRLLDVGGGEGAFLEAVGRRWPHLQLELFDLPAVCQRAELRLAGAGLGQRARTHPGDFLRDPLPEGADIVSLVRILHDHDDEAVFTILRAARRALAPGGTLLIVEPMAQAPGAASVGAYFSLYLHAMGRGRPRKPRELRALLRRAGFTEVHMPASRLPLAAGLIRAR